MSNPHTKRYKKIVHTYRNLLQWPRDDQAGKLLEVADSFHSSPNVPYSQFSLCRTTSFTSSLDVNFSSREEFKS